MIEIPNHGTQCKFVYVDTCLYIVRDKWIYNNNHRKAHISFKIINDLTLIKDTVELIRDKNQLEYIYGNKVNMYKKDDRWFFETKDYIYELPEEIPDFDEFLLSVGFNERYIVYFVLKEKNYEMVVLKYN